MIVVFTSEPSAGLLGGIAVGITQIIVVLYLVDRILVRKLTYKQVLFGELVFGIIIALYFSYQESTIDINIQTNKDYVLVLFDSKDNLLSDFEMNGLFGKELNVYENIIHVDSTLYRKKDLIINEPEIWGGFRQDEGTVELNGQLVNYTLRTNDNPDLTIDSLLNKIKE